MTTKTLIRFIAVSVAGLFFYAAAVKLDKYSLFQLQLQKFPFSISLIKQQAWMIPVIELLIAGLLLMPAYRLKGLFASLFLFGLYTIYLTCMLDNRYAFPCHCGEVLQSFSLKAHIIFNFVCVFVVGVGIVLCGMATERSVHGNKKFPFVRPDYKPTDKAVEKMN